MRSARAVRARGMITRENLDRLRCEIVCGAANNVLAEDSLAADLDARGILYAPDFIVNSGGLISVYSELNSLPRDRGARRPDRRGARDDPRRGR